MDIKSREVTYVIAVEQIFFEDDSQLIIRVGTPTSSGGDFDIEFDWVTDKPDWADYLDEYTLVNYDILKEGF